MLEIRLFKLSNPFFIYVKKFLCFVVSIEIFFVYYVYQMFIQIMFILLCLYRFCINLFTLNNTFKDGITFKIRFYRSDLFSIYEFLL